MNDAPVQEIEGMGAAPPPGSICRIPVMRQPEVSLVILDPVEISNILGPACSLEYAQIFTL
jgi:hypothetical protein